MLRGSCIACCRSRSRHSLWTRDGPRVGLLPDLSNLQYRTHEAFQHLRGSFGLGLDQLSPQVGVEAPEPLCKFAITAAAQPFLEKGNHHESVIHLATAGDNIIAPLGSRSPPDIAGQRVVE